MAPRKKAATDESGAATDEMVTIQHPNGTRVAVSRFAFTELYEPSGFVEAKEADVEYGEGDLSPDAIATPRDADLRDDPALYAKTLEQAAESNPDTPAGPEDTDDSEEPKE